MFWARVQLSGIALAWHVQGPGIYHWYHERERRAGEEKRREDKKKSVLQGIRIKAEH